MFALFDNQQLSSISGLDNSEETSIPLTPQEIYTTDGLDLPAVEEVTAEESPPEPVTTEMGPKASEDSRFARFFKMVQFGVPVPAVKLKMQVEGIDSNILE